jgi:arsenite-transporting ATPase
MRVRREDTGEYILSLALPLAEKGDVALARSAEDLVVTVGGHRRLVALPETLRRCEVAGAQLADGHLTVSFAEPVRSAP